MILWWGCATPWISLQHHRYGKLEKHITFELTQEWLPSGNVSFMPFKIFCFRVLLFQSQFWYCDNIMISMYWITPQEYYKRVIVYTFLVVSEHFLKDGRWFLHVHPPSKNKAKVGINPKIFCDLSWLVLERVCTMSWESGIYFSLKSDYFSFTARNSNLECGV